MENDEPLDPMNVSFLCARAIVTRANRLAHLIKQLRLGAAGAVSARAFAFDPPSITAQVRFVGDVC